MSNNAWMVRAGQGGYLIDDFKKGLVAIGWHELGELSDATPAAFRERLAKVYPESSPGEIPLTLIDLADLVTEYNETSTAVAAR